MIISKEGKITLAITNGKYCARKSYDDSDVKIDENIPDCKISETVPPIEPEIQKKLSEIATTNTSLGVNTVNACATSGKCPTGTPFVIKVNDIEEYKFYVVKDTTDKVTLLMNKNMVDSVAWINKEDYEKAGGKNWESNTDRNNKGPLTVLNALEEATKNWTNIASYDYTLVNDKDDGNGTNTYQAIERKKVRARLLNRTEAAALGCKNNSYSCPSFFSDNIGTQSTQAAYWFSTASSTNSQKAIGIMYFYCFTVSDVESGVKIGVRPVIEIVK